ncbi:pyridoxamine 5'-phosphate oxidase family protein [Ilumatobacter nonamiensis]|uniref:pyridoxamine 5'-phosphate oxidase family protein n=1 Tax=Ilumatobacter nonamiensis TaxID=467093 RepID=UPI0011D1AD59|nr:pyridoxamine 5'-phosphate oxidase family protein [Ilumatobacter nonamiensis]
MTRDEIDAFLAEPRDAVLSVVLGSGRAMGTPIWFCWVDGVARFQSPTTSAKVAALRSRGRASLCVHEHSVPLARYVTLEGPVREVDFDMDTDIGAAARHYLGDGADRFIAGIDAALDAGRRWASFELTPTFIEGKTQTLA